MRNNERDLIRAIESRLLVKREEWSSTNGLWSKNIDRSHDKFVFSSRKIVGTKKNNEPFQNILIFNFFSHEYIYLFLYLILNAFWDQWLLERFVGGSNCPDGTQNHSTFWVLRETTNICSQWCFCSSLQKIISEKVEWKGSSSRRSMKMRVCRITPW